MTLDIPFDAQLDSTFHRMCGAACLSMIYKYYGISDDQNTVWQRIAQPDNNGNLYVRTFRLCADLLCNGIHSVIIKAVNPLRVLSICNHNDFSAILCYRLNKKSNAGHFTVFEKLKGDYVIVNDPLQRKDRRISKKTILKLWRPTDGNEVVGNILIPLTMNCADKNICSACNKEIPSSMICPECKSENSIPLKPTEVLGCTNDDCSQKTWEFIVCPFCDGRIYHVP